MSKSKNKEVHIHDMNSLKIRGSGQHSMDICMLCRVKACMRTNERTNERTNDSANRSYSIHHHHKVKSDQPTGRSSHQYES